MKLFEVPMTVLAVLGFCFLLSPDGPTAHADFTFGEVVNLGAAINTPGLETSHCPSPNGLELYFCRGGAAGEIWVSRRASLDSEWGPASNLGPIVNSPSIDGPSSISSDGLSFYLDSDRTGGCGGVDMWVTSRATMNDNWGTADTLYDISPYAWGDGKVDIKDLKTFIAEWEKQNPSTQP